MRPSDRADVDEELLERYRHLIEVDQERVVAVRRVDLDVLARRATGRSRSWIWRCW